jgi:hypothetical protein
MQHLLARVDVDALDYDSLLQLEELMERGARPRLAASAHMIDELPTMCVPSGSPLCKQRCLVCQERIKAGDELRTLPCIHSFHSQCVDQWLNSSKTCPVCKRHIDEQ